MDAFIAQLNHLLMSADEDSWLTGLINLLKTHIDAWVKLTGRSNKIITEALPSCGIRPENPMYYIDKPILSGDTVLGHLSIARQASPFTRNEEQIIEISVCLCVMQLRQLEKQAINERVKRAKAVREAINALSYSELEVAAHIVHAVNAPEGRLVAGAVADKLGIARSVVVTALKKLEGAGVIETRSLGVKGTFIRIKEPILTDELGKLGATKI